jgi:hypothetical protein
VPRLTPSTLISSFISTPPPFHVYLIHGVHDALSLVDVWFIAYNKNPNNNMMSTDHALTLVSRLLLPSLCQGERSPASWCSVAPALAASLRADAGCSLVRGSLFLSPAFHPFDMALPLPPTIKYIGPVLAAPGRPLPEPLASYLAAGPTLLFSAGTYVR